MSSRSVFSSNFTFKNIQNNATEHTLGLSNNSLDSVFTGGGFIGPVANTEKSTHSQTGAAHIMPTHQADLFVKQYATALPILFDSSGVTQVFQSSSGSEMSLQAAISVSAATSFQAASFSGTLQPLISTGLNQPTGVAIDSQGNVYIADSNNFIIREVTAGSQTVTDNLLANLGYSLTNITVDKNGNLYVFDSYNNVIDEIAAGSHTVSTLTSVYAPYGIGMTVDANGNLFLAQGNAVKEKLAGSSSFITLATGFIRPQGIAEDSAGNLYVADTGNNSVKEIQAGTNTVSVLASGLHNPQGIAVDNAGNVYIADTQNNTIDEIVAGSQTLTTLVASGLNNPSGITVDSQGNLYIADSNDNRIVELKAILPTISSVSLNASTGVLTIAGSNLSASGAGITLNDLTLSGGPGGSFTLNANDTISNFSSSGFNVKLSSADLAVVDMFANANGFYPLTGAAYNLSTSNNWDNGLGLAVSNQPVNVSSATPITTTQLVYTSMPVMSSFGYSVTPDSYYGIAVDKQGNIYVADNYNNPNSGGFYSPPVGEINQFVNGSTFSNTLVSNYNPMGFFSSFGQPVALTVDAAGNNYFTDGNSIWEVVNGSGSATQIATPGLPISDLTIDKIGNLFFISSSGSVNELAAGSLSLSTVVNSGLNNPSGIAVDSNGNLYIADSGNNAIKEIASSNHAVSNLVSSGLNHPTAITTDAANNIYFYDSGNNAIKEISAISHQVNTLASNMPGVTGITADGNGDLYISTATQIEILSFATATPKISGVSYDPSAGALTLSGSNLNQGILNGGAFTLTGDNGNSYTLTSNSLPPTYGYGFGTVGFANISPATGSVTLYLNPADQLAINGLFNQNGNQAISGNNYQLSATSGWDTNASAVNNMPVTVLNAVTPSISAVNYNAATGVFTFTGNNLSNYGSANGINLGDFSLIVGANQYTFKTGQDIVSNLSKYGFNVTLSSADLNSVNNLVTANGLTAANNSAYNLTASTHWDGDNGAAMTTQPVNVITQTQIASGLNSPEAVATDKAGNLYVANISSNQLLEIAAGTHTITSLATAANSIQGITVDNAGNVYYASYGLIQELNASNQQTTTLYSTTGYTANALAVDANGNVYFNDNSGNLDKIAAGSKILSTLGTGGNGVAVDNAGNVYTDVNGNIEKINIATKAVTVLTSNIYLNTSNSLSVDNSGNVYVNTYNGSNGYVIDKISSNGSITTNLNAPTFYYGLAVDSLSNLYVTDNSAGAIQEFASQTPTPLLTGIYYNASTGVINLYGSNLTSNLSDYQVNHFSISGDGGNYTLSASSVISGTPGNNLSITLSANDQKAIANLLDKNGILANDGVSNYGFTTNIGWDGSSSKAFTQGINVNHVISPSISGVSYNAASGVFTVTGSNLLNGNISLNHLSFSAGLGSYSFGSNDVIGNTTATGFTITLSNTDKGLVNAFVNANGISAYGGATYNLASSAKWDGNTSNAISTQGVSVNGVSTSLTGASYNASNGQLSLTGASLSSNASDYKITDFSITGDGGSSYTLTSGSAVLGTPNGVGFTIQLSSADQLAIDGLLNKNGVQANDGLTNYNLSALSGWDTSAAAAVNTQSITVSQSTAPTINGVTYNAANGTFIVTGGNLVNHGNTLGIALQDLSLSGGNGSYTFNAANDSVSNLSASGFTINLSSADKTAVNGIFDANGNKSFNGTVYNLSSSANWDSDNGLAIATQPVTVTGIAAQTPIEQNLFTSNSAWLSNGSSGSQPYWLLGSAPDSQGNVYFADYNAGIVDMIAAGSHNVSVLATGFYAPNSTATDTGGNVYVADNNGNIDKIYAGTNTATLLFADGSNLPSAIRVDQTGNVFFADATGIKEIASGSFTASSVTTAINYNNTWTIDNAGNIYYVASVGTNNYALNEINAQTHATTNLLSGGLSLHSPGSMALDSAGDVFITDNSYNGLSIPGIEKIAAGNHAISTVYQGKLGQSFNGLNLDSAGNLYISNNISSASGYYSSVQEILSNQPQTTSSVNPSIQTVAYNAATGVLSITGNHLTPTASDYNLADFTLLGDTGASYTLSLSQSTVVVAGNNLSIQLSAHDQQGVSALFDQNGYQGNDASTYYKLFTNSGWDTGASASTTSVKVSNVSAPTITSVSYNAATSVFTFSGNHLLTTGGGIALNDFTMSGGGINYHFALGDGVVSNLSNFGFSVALNPNYTSISAMDSIFNNNGSNPQTGAAYTISTTANWDSNSGNAILAQPVTVSGFSPSYTTQTLLSDGGVSYPIGLSVDSQNNLYYVDFNSNSIKELAAGSQTPTTLVSGLNTPTGNIALDSAGNVYFADVTNNAIKEYVSSSHTFKTLVSAGLSQPIGIAVDSKGDVFFADSGSNTIKEILAGGTTATTVCSAPGVNEIALDSAGNIYFSQPNYNSISEYQTSSKTVSTLAIPGLSNPYGISIDSSGNLYVSDQSGIKEISAGSNTVNILKNSLTSAPINLALSSAGNVYFTDNNTQIVGELAINPPTISKVSYAANTGILTVTGSNIGSSINLSKLVLDIGNIPALLLSGESVSNLSSTGFTVLLKYNDIITVNNTFNFNGNSSGGNIYNLSEFSGWTSNSASTGSQTVTVSGSIYTSINISGFNNNLTLFDNATVKPFGGISLTDSNATDSDSANISILSSNGTLSGNGLSAGYQNGNLTIYALTATTASNLQSELQNLTFTPTAHQVASGQTVSTTFNLSVTGNKAGGSNTPATVNYNTAQTVVTAFAPGISSSSYNASTGILTLNGNLTSNVSDYNPAAITITGDTGGSYSLSSGSSVFGTPTTTSMSIKLSSADQLAIDGLLNKNGVSANDNTNYNLSAAAGWDGGSSQSVISQGITVNNVTAPSIGSVSYDSNTGIFTFTGSNLANHGSTNGILLNDFSLLVAGAGKYTFSNLSDTVSNLSNSQFTVTLNTVDKSAVDTLLNHNGGTAFNGSSYNLNVHANWDADNGAAIINQAVSVKNVFAANLLSSGLNGPSAVAVDASGNVYYADYGLSSTNTYQYGSIGKIAAGSLSSGVLVSSGLNSPSGLTVDSLGNVYIADTRDNVIKEYVAASKTLTTVVSGISNPEAITIDSSNNLYVANYSGVVTKFAAGTHAASTLISTGLSNPFGITLDSQKNIYIADTGNLSIKEYTASSNYTSYVQTATGAFSSPVSVAVDSYGNIYFTDNVNNTVNEIVAGTHAISTVFSTGSNSYPQGIAIDNSGNLYITKALLFAPNPDSNAVIELNHVSYLFNSLPPATPTAVNNLWENTQQIDISKSVFTAFASSGSVSAANFSNASAATSSSDYLFYNASTGGLYYDADGNGSSPAVEIAVVGVNSHPSALSIGDFKLVA